jgi:hypothetical protein
MKERRSEQSERRFDILVAYREETLYNQKKGKVE